MRACVRACVRAYILWLLHKHYNIIVLCQYLVYIYIYIHQSLFITLHGPGIVQLRIELVKQEGMERRNSAQESIQFKVGSYS